MSKYLCTGAGVRRLGNLNRSTHVPACVFLVWKPWVGDCDCGVGLWLGIGCLLILVVRISAGDVLDFGKVDEANRYRVKMCHESVFEKMMAAA